MPLSPFTSCLVRMHDVTSCHASACVCMHANTEERFEDDNHRHADRNKSKGRHSHRVRSHSLSNATAHTPGRVDARWGSGSRLEGWSSTEKAVGFVFVSTFHFGSPARDGRSEFPDLFSSVRTSLNFCAHEFHNFTLQQVEVPTKGIMPASVHHNVISEL